MSTQPRKSFQVDVEPAPGEGPQTKEEWIGQAPLKVAKRKATRPWERFDKTAAAKFNFNLRLNEYERELLEHGARLGGRSMQQEAKRLLIAALEKAVRGAKVEPEQSQNGAEAEP
jgi:hypothetical protein